MAPPAPKATTSDGTETKPTETQPTETQPRISPHRTVRVCRSKGYSGKTGDQGWVSRVNRVNDNGVPTGHTVEPSEMDWGDSELYRKNKGTWHAIYWLTSPGIYHVHPGGGYDDYYIYIRVDPDLGVKWGGITEQRAADMWRLINDGMGVQEAALATRPPVPEEVA